MEYHPSSPPPWLPGWATVDLTSDPDHPVRGALCTMPGIIKAIIHHGFCHSQIKCVVGEKQRNMMK
jgi:hypothetical protein